MAATSVAVEMLKLLLLLLLLLLEDAKSSWDSESREASFTGASGFVCRPQANYARRISGSHVRPMSIHSIVDGTPGLKPCGLPRLWYSMRTN